MHKFVQGIYIPLLALIASTASAQQKVDSTRIYQLGEVVISSPQVRPEILPKQTLEGEALRRLSVHSVADAIRYFSGTQIKDYGGVGGLKTVNIRSMGTHHVGVFYDGIELSNAQNGVVDLGRFSLDNMEAVSLYNGQKSAIFQPAKDFSSAGSIYLQSRTPQFAEGETHHIRTTLKAGSFGTVNPAFGWEQRLSDKLSSSLSAEYLYTTGRYRFRYRVAEGYDTTATRQNGDVNALRLESGLFGKLDQGYWRAKAYVYRSERGYPGAVVKNKFSHEDRQWDTNFFVQGSMKRDFSQHYSLLLSGKYAYDYLHYLADPRRDEALMYVDNKYHRQEFYLSAAQRWQLFPTWHISLSTDYQLDVLRANLENFAYPRRHTALAALATEVKWGRVDLQASLLGTFVAHHTRGKNPGTNHTNRLTPTFIASYRPLEDADLQIRAFYKRIFRMPTLSDLYYTFIGSVDLEPENTTQYNIGVAYTKQSEHSILRRFEAHIDAYFNTVENKIVAMPTSNFFRWTMVNLGEVEIRGVETAVRTDWQLNRNWEMTGQVNYTFQRAQDFTDASDPYYGGQIPYIPRHSGSATVGLGYRSWTANYSFIYTGERYSSRANIPVNYVLPWYTSDLSLSKQLSLRKGILKLTLEVNNLLNQSYEVVACYPMPGINFRTIVHYEF